MSRGSVFSQKEFEKHFKQQKAYKKKLSKANAIERARFHSLDSQKLAKSSPNRSEDSSSN
jgi:hypothetical protein